MDSASRDSRPGGARRRVGIGGYTFVYAKGASYLTDNAAACANCHIMQPHYDAWLKSAHYAVATCNDCHTPAALVPKYLTKAENGSHHSLAFTTGKFHEPIMIRGVNRAVAEASCRKCHAQLVSAIESPSHHRDSALSCLCCHAGVGHPK